MKKVLIIGFTCCLVISLVFFLRARDFKMVIGLVGTIGYRFSFLLLTTFIAYFFGTISWQYALGAYAKCVSTGRLFLIRHVGETVGMFNPTSVIGGDALKALLLSRYDIPRKQVVWSIVFSRATMVFSQLLLFVAMALAMVICYPALWLNGLYHGNDAGFYPLFMAGWKRMRMKLSAGVRELPLMLGEHKKVLFLSGVFALLHWVFGGLEFYLILKFLGLKVSVIQALLVDLGVVLFKAAGAFVPGQLGVEEYGNKIMLMLIGIPAAEIWVSASILRRARQLFWIVFAIVVYVMMFKKQEPAVQG